MTERYNVADDDRACAEGKCPDSLRQNAIGDSHVKKLQEDRQRKANKRRMESTSDRDKRLRSNREYMARVSGRETTDEHIARLKRNREYKSRKRAMIDCKDDDMCVETVGSSSNGHNDDARTKGESERICNKRRSCSIARTRCGTNQSSSSEVREKSSKVLTENIHTSQSNRFITIGQNE
jgi:hypothetical protein